MSMNALKAFLNSSAVSSDGCYAVSWSLNGMIYMIFIGDPPSVVAFKVNPMYGIKSVGFTEDMTAIIIVYGYGISVSLSAVLTDGSRRIPIPVIEPFWSMLPQETKNIVNHIASNYSAYWKLNLFGASRKIPPGLSFSQFRLPPEMPASFDWAAWASEGKRFLPAPVRRQHSPLEMVGGVVNNFAKEDLQKERVKGRGFKMHKRLWGL